MKTKLAYPSNRERAQEYSKAFPKFPPLQSTARWLMGVWIAGNDYRGSGFHGSFPPGFLKRTFSLFPEAKTVLHLFSGSLKRAELKKKFPHLEHIRFDRLKSVRPDVCGEADDLHKHFKAKSFDLVIADPPYSESDAQRYGTCLIKRNKVLKAARRIVRTGGSIVWLDMILPMYSGKELEHYGAIAIVRSTNHRFRMASIFRRKG